jgi:hypothetical protein
LHAVRRVIVGVPARAPMEQSFSQSLHEIQVLSQQLSARLLIVGPQVGDPRFQARCSSIEPRVPSTFHQCDLLRHVPEFLARERQADDLLVLLSARHHRVSWTPALASLPQRLAAEFPDLPFLVLYAAE